MKLLNTIIRKQNRSGYPCKVVFNTYSDESAHHILAYHLITEGELSSHDGVIVKKYKDRYLVMYQISLTTETMWDICRIFLHHIDS